MLKLLLSLSLIISSLFGGFKDEVVITGSEKQIVIYENHESLKGYQKLGKIESQQSEILGEANETEIFEQVEGEIFKRHNYKKYNMTDYSQITSYFIEDVVLFEIWEK